MIFRQGLWLWGERSTELSWGIFLSAGEILPRGQWRWMRKFSLSITVTWISAAWLPSNSQYPPGTQGLCPCWIFPTCAWIPHGAFHTPDKTLSYFTRPLIVAESIYWVILLIRGGIALVRITELLRNAELDIQIFPPVSANPPPAQIPALAIPFWLSSNFKVSPTLSYSTR